MLPRVLGANSSASRPVRPRRVRVVGEHGVFYVHPALARKRRCEKAWHRPRGQSFRLKAVPAPQRATAPTGARDETPRTTVQKVVLYGTGPLRCATAHAFSDGRVLRGAILSAITAEFGRELAWYLSNHDATRKSPLAVSISRANPRRAFLTLLAPDDPDAAALFRELPSLLKGRCLTMGDGRPGTHTVRILDASSVAWRPRGVFLDVLSASPSQALARVPGAIRARRRTGTAEKRAEGAPYRVPTRRLRRVPPQVGSMGAYGYGVLA